MSFDFAAQDDSPQIYPSFTVGSSVDPASDQNETTDFQNRNTVALSWPSSTLEIFKICSIPGIMRIGAGFEKPYRRNLDMHDLLIALAFIGIVFAPVVVAAKSGTDEAK
jgi:hypothetical protein